MPETPETSERTKESRKTPLTEFTILVAVADGATNIAKTSIAPTPPIITTTAIATVERRT